MRKTAPTLLTLTLSLLAAAPFTPFRADAQQTAEPSAWTSHGGALASAPVAVASAEGRIDVFARGSDDALWHRWFDGQWYPWQSLGGVFVGTPAAVSWDGGQIDVFARDASGALQHRYFDGSWHGWELLGGVLDGDPVAISRGDGHLDVFARGKGGALWHRAYDGAWSGWRSLGGAIVGRPSVVRWARGDLDVFARGVDDKLQHISFRRGWFDWESLSGALASDPAAVSWAPGHIDVFTTGADASLWLRTFDGGRWQDWTWLGDGIAAEQPGVFSDRAGRVDLYPRSAAGPLLHKSYQTGGTYEESLHGTPAGGPAALVPTAEHVDVFIRGADGALWQHRHPAPGL